MFGHVCLVVFHVRYTHSCLFPLFDIVQVLGDNIAVIRATGFGEENSIEAFEVVPDGDNYIDCTLTNEFCDGSNTPFALRDKCSLVTSSPICPSNN
jgi:hypothetical protein